jgi:hypothetical protein
MSAQKAFSNWSGFKATKDRKSIALKQAITARILEAGMVYENDATNNAPHDLGHHKQNIGFRPISWHTIRMFANATYAPFLEFGTGGSVSVPNGWQDIAIKFKGKGKKKINLPARPHLIPAFYKAKEFLKKKIIEDVKQTQN